MDIFHDDDRYYSIVFQPVSFLTHYYVHISGTIFKATFTLTTLNLNTTSTQIFPYILARSRKSKPNATPKTGNIWVMSHQQLTT